MSGDLTPISKELVRVFDAYDDSAKKIAAILTGYAHAVEALGHPNEVGILGGAVPTKFELLTAAVRNVDKETLPKEMWDKHRWLYVPHFGEVREWVVQRLLQALEESNKVVDADALPLEEQARRSIEAGAEAAQVAVAARDRAADTGRRDGDEQQGV